MNPGGDRVARLSRKPSGSSDTPGIRGHVERAPSSNTHGQLPINKTLVRHLDTLARHAKRIAHKGGVISSKLRKCGMEVLAAGATRIALRIPEGVLKVDYVPTFGTLMGNHQEALVWKALQEASGWKAEAIRKALVPILATSDLPGDWVLMEYAQSTGIGRLTPEVRDILLEAGFADLRPPNFSDDGRLLDYDYLDFSLFKKWLDT